MKIGVISDTHIPERAKAVPKQVLEAFKHVDMIIHAGDLEDLTVLDSLAASCKNVVAVAGNMDSPQIHKKLKEKEIITAGGKRIAVMHGFGSPNRLIGLLQETFKNEKVDIIVFGHSHIPTNEENNGILYFNPGSPTDTIFAPYTSYGIIEIGDTVKARIVKL